MVRPAMPPPTGRPLHATAIAAALLVLACLGPAAAARADDVVVAPAASAQNIASAGGYIVWAAPREGTGWKLVVRAPDGTVAVPRIPGFATPVEAAVGVVGRRVYAVYSRTRSGNADLFSLDLRSLSEGRLPAFATREYDETAPSFHAHVLAFVRSGGRRDGVYAWTDGRGRSRRISAARAIATATNGTRVAYATRDRVVVRAVSGRDAGGTRFASPERPRSLALTSTGRAYWYGGAGRVFRTARVVRAGGGARRVEPATTLLPPSTTSLALVGGAVGLYADGTAIRRVGGPLFSRASGRAP